METSDTCLDKWTFCSDSVVQMPSEQVCMKVGFWFMDAFNAHCAFVVDAKLTVVPG